MAQTPEGKVKAKVRKLFSLYGTSLYSFWPVQSGFGAQALDCHASYHGFAFIVETKAPGKQLTPRQKITKKTIELSDTPVFVVAGDKSLHLLEQWLDSIGPKENIRSTT